MKFGLFYQLPCADSQSEPTRYQETLEQIRVADELGFDCAWLAELHFFKSFSIAGSTPTDSFLTVRCSPGWNDLPPKCSLRSEHCRAISFMPWVRGGGDGTCHLSNVVVELLS